MYAGKDGVVEGAGKQQAPAAPYAKAAARAGSDQAALGEHAYRSTSEALCQSAHIISTHIHVTCDETVSVCQLAISGPSVSVHRLSVFDSWNSCSSARVARCFHYCWCLETSVTRSG